MTLTLTDEGQSVCERLNLDTAESRRGLVVARQGPVAVVLFDRPDVGNAFTFEMLYDLSQLWLDFKADASVRCVVLGSTTDRAFSTGIDLKAAVGSAGFGGKRVVPGSGTVHRDADMWKPVICAVEGRTIGGGLHWVTNADIVVASRTATFKDTHVNHGFVGAGENVALGLKAGLGATLYLSIVGGAIELDARRACELGLVQEIVPPGTTLARALELAAAISKNSPSAVSGQLRALWALGRMHYDEARLLAEEIMLRQQMHPDAAEGPRAFAERREPSWQTG